MALTASNPLMADEVSSRSRSPSGSGQRTPHRFDELYVPIDEDNPRAMSPGNASTSSSHSRVSSSGSTSTWRRNNPYNLRRGRNGDAFDGSPSESPAHSSSRHDHPAGSATSHPNTTGALDRGGSFGNSQVVDAFIFDVSHISAADDGQALQRRSSSSWTSTSSTFDKASGRVLERTGEDSKKHTGVFVEGIDDGPHASSWGCVVGANETSLVAVSSTKRIAPPAPPANIDHADEVLGCSNSFMIEAAGPASLMGTAPPRYDPAPPPPPPPSGLEAPPQTGTTPHSAVDGPFELLPPGIMITVFPPNNSQAHAQQIPSDKILRTSGASNVFQVLMCAQRQRDEKAGASGRAPSATQVKQPHSLKPKHCAHFQFKKICNLGSDCNFIHSLLPISPAAAPGGAGIARLGGSEHTAPTALVGTAAPPPPPPHYSPAPAQSGVHHSRLGPAAVHQGSFAVASNTFDMHHRSPVPAYHQPPPPPPLQQQQPVIGAHPAYGQQPSNAYYQTQQSAPSHHHHHQQQQQQHAGGFASSAAPHTVSPPFPQRYTTTFTVQSSSPLPLQQHGANHGASPITYMQQSFQQNGMPTGGTSAPYYAPPNQPQGPSQMHLSYHQQQHPSW